MRFKSGFVMSTNAQSGCGRGEK